MLQVIKVVIHFLDSMSVMPMEVFMAMIQMMYWVIWATVMKRETRQTSTTMGCSCEPF